MEANDVIFSKVIFNSMPVTSSNNLSWNVIDKFKLYIDEASEFWICQFLMYLSLLMENEKLKPFINLEVVLH